MKKIVTCCVLLAAFFAANAEHITGGEMYYIYTGLVRGMNTYHVTFKLFKDCFVNRQFPNPAVIGVFHKATGEHVTDIAVPLDNTQTLDLTNGGGPCISDPPEVCYNVAYYEFDVSVPPSSDGYLLSCQVVYRINGISNLVPGYGNVGATYTGELPGGDNAQNYSAQFIGSDLVIVCANQPFTYSFAARDPDNDKLRYHFCEAYQGGAGNGSSSEPPAPPPYESVPYGGIYSGSSPLGPAVQIDPNNGLITGIAPDAGTYVVTVCVDEIRNGVVIATQRKDLQIKIAPCTIAAAQLPPAFMLCRDTKTISFTNLILSPLINTYNWEITNSAGTVIDTSTSRFPSYTFTDTGTYKIKLVINRNGDCSDSATSLARVYPGFFPGLNFNGICFNKPTQFIDISTTVYGQVNSWKWDFGETNAVDDTSLLQNPQYTYPSMGLKSIRLIAGNINGCIDTTFKDISIVDKPPITLAFKDTLICVPDAVQLQAAGEGIFSWSPPFNIVNANTPTPVVSPAATTTYIVNLNDQGCTNSDSVKVRVVDHVTLQAMNDTTICSGDTIILRVSSNGLRYAWTPASQFIDPGLPVAVAITANTTSYEVTASIGSCSTKDQVLVKTVPYPLVYAGADTSICFNTSAQLNATTDGNAFSWTANPTLSNTSVLNPIASPKITTAYIFSATDTKGCPKSSHDTVVVITLPPIHPSAGADTVVVVGQPLQLLATGGIQYKWVPGISLSNPNIGNPVAIFNEPTPGIVYTVFVYNEAGCVDSAYKRVKVYQTKPTVFVPNGFTPNGDGRNDLLRPIAVGIKQIEYFNIYNRWGQMIYHSGNSEGGWDGTISGKAQEPGTFVWVVKAIDYTGALYFSKGTVTLIR